MTLGNSHEGDMSSSVPESIKTMAHGLSVAPKVDQSSVTICTTLAAVVTCFARSFSVAVGVLVGAVSRYCHFWYRLFGPQQPWQIFVRCVLVKTLQYHDAVDFVQDSETEDPQFVAEPWRGTKPWQDNGKELMRTQQWDHGWNRIHLQVSQRQHWRTLADNGNATFDSGRLLHRCRRTGRVGWLLRQLKRREPDCSRGRHGRCVGAG